MKSKFMATPVLVLAILVYPHPEATAQSCTSTAGPNNAGSFSTATYAGSSFNWSNPGNAQVSDANYATAGLTLGILTTAYSNYLVIQNFGFSIPSSATICQIVVEVLRSETGLAVGGGVKDKSVRLLKNGALYGNDLASGAYWPFSDATATYGNALLASTWGGSWQPADVNSTNFGVAISTELRSGLASVALQGMINQVRVTIIYDANTTLGITLGRFSAASSPDGDGHELNWTAAAAPGDRFVIQRSGNSSDWQDIAAIPASATATLASQAGGSSLLPYSYTDHDPLNGANFYRLRMVNVDGKSAYSNISELIRVGNPTVRCWPNPCVQTINISSPQPVNKILLKDIQGRILYMRQTGTPVSEWQIPAGGLPPGLYLVQVGSQTLRVFKRMN